MCSYLFLRSLKYSGFYTYSLLCAVSLDSPGNVQLYCYGSMCLVIGSSCRPLRPLTTVHCMNWNSSKSLMSIVEAGHFLLYQGLWYGLCCFSGQPVPVPVSFYWCFVNLSGCCLSLLLPRLTDTECAKLLISVLIKIMKNSQLVF